MKGLLLTSAIVAVFVAVVLTMRLMAPHEQPEPQLAAVTPTVERTRKTDKTEPDNRVIPLAKPPPLPDPPKIEEPPPAPPKVEPPKEDNAALPSAAAPCVGAAREQQRHLRPLRRLQGHHLSPRLAVVALRLSTPEVSHAASRQHHPRRMSGWRMIAVRAAGR